VIQILYGTGSTFHADMEHGVHLGAGDHENRAKALAGVTPGSQCGPVDISGIQKPGLDTLCYWGHGNATKFCDFTPAEFVADISKWKKWNPGIKTVEIITCNARHSTDDVSYTSRAKADLKRKHPDIVLKAMPMGMGSSGAHNWSILKAHTPSKTWFYVTAGGQKDTDEMWPAVHVVENEAQNHGSNLAVASAAVEKNTPLRKFGLKYGTFDKLRSVLVTVA